MKYQAFAAALACGSALSVALASQPAAPGSAALQVDTGALVRVKAVRKTVHHRTVKRTVTRRTTHTHSSSSSSGSGHK